MTNELRVLVITRSHRLHLDVVSTNGQSGNATGYRVSVLQFLFLPATAADAARWHGSCF